MLDWWQALLYLLAGGLITVAASYATHYWTTKASRETEERQAKRRLGEEQRQVIRQLRRERMQPVLDFLDIARRCAAREAIERAVDAVYETLGPEVKPSVEEWAKMKTDAFAADPDLIQEARAVSAATLASMSLPELRAQLLSMYAALPRGSDPKTKGEFRGALRSVEQLMEQYLAAAEPHEPTADDPSQEA